MVLKLNMIQTVAVAVVVLLVGEGVKKRVPFLDKYCIPSPVVGGVLFAILALILKQTGIMTFDMDVTLQEVFMTAFFTSIGFKASMRLLKKGGLQVFIFLCISILLVISQNVLGISLAKVFNLDPILGLCVGSVPMVGGHATSGAFGALFEKMGVTGASTVAIAAATFGLVSGSMIGGPLAKTLIERKHIVTPRDEQRDINIKGANEAGEELSCKESSKEKRFTTASFEIVIAMGLGTIISSLLQKTGATFPVYIGAMFAAAIMRNILDNTSIVPYQEEEIEIIGNISLSIFLSMALIGLRLWELADLALPLIVMLLGQTVLMIAFAYFITFNIMGRDYEAAVMASGMCGFGMGATPNAMANMQALTVKYGDAARAFFVIPLVGSLFIDFCNVGIITAFMNFVK
ncbi:MAG: sodium/glutamate symporter [Clostridioides sp.]|jgi:ESS family glutamate:Na+ symporter|nr:sodium/glutamate symporter [Clostridioides sp.]